MSQPFTPSSPAELAGMYAVEITEIIVVIVVVIIIVRYFWKKKKSRS